MAATPLLEPDLSDVESESSGTVFSMDSTAADASAVDEDEPSSATALDQLDGSFNYTYFAPKMLIFSRSWPR